MDVPYKCTKCAKSHTMTFFADEHEATVIQCPHCGAGKGRTLPEMIQNRIGMFPQKHLTVVHGE